MDAVQNNTSKHIHAKQQIDGNGKWPVKKTKEYF